MGEGIKRFCICFQNIGIPARFQSLDRQQGKILKKEFEWEKKPELELVKVTVSRKVGESRLFSGALAFSERFDGY
jgi:hypothetical protein